VKGRQIKHELQHAAADALHAPRDARQLVLSRFQRWREVAGRGAVIEGARGGKAECAGTDRVGRKRRHHLVVFDCGRIAPRATLAHDINAQGRMRKLRADTDVEISLRQPVHVVRKAFPGPGNACAQHRLRNVLNAFHQLNQPQMVVRPARREAHPAIAHDRGGDSVLCEGVIS